MIVFDANFGRLTSPVCKPSLWPYSNGFRMLRRLDAQCTTKPYTVMIVLDREDRACNFSERDSAAEPE
jgi:hypothetical protein